LENVKDFQGLNAKYTLGPDQHWSDDLSGLALYRVQGGQFRFVSAVQ
jgi:hypothetical protein